MLILPVIALSTGYVFFVFCEGNERVGSKNFDKFDEYIASARKMPVLIVVFSFFEISYMQVARDKISKRLFKSFL